MTVPIDPTQYPSGVKVVDIGDLRVARGKSRRRSGKCKHLYLVYDALERRIWCSDCENDVEPFDAFSMLCERWANETADLERRREALIEAEQHAIRSRAAKAMDHAWQSRTTSPCCPHCRHPLLPEDMIAGLPFVSRDIEMQRRKRSEP